jgi:plasmid stabilization system protein ParE
VKVAWSRQARRELAGLRSYIARDRPSAADRVAARIMALAQRLETFPYLGYRHPDGFRELVEPTWRFVVRYRFLPAEEVAETIVIVSIRHPRQDSS